MSVILQAAVWKSNLPPGQMLTALALADHGHDDGSHIFPSKDYLHWKTGLTLRQVHYHLRAFEAMKFLVPVGSRKGGRGLATLYWMDVTKLTMKADYEHPNSAIIAPFSTQTVQSLHPLDENSAIIAPFSDEGAERVQSATERVQSATERVQSATNRSIGNHKVTINGNGTRAREEISDEMPSICYAGTPAGMRAWVRSRQGEAIMRAAGEQVMAGSAEYPQSRVMRHYRLWCKDENVDCTV